MDEEENSPSMTIRFGMLQYSANSTIEASENMFFHLTIYS